MSNSSRFALRTIRSIQRPSYSLIENKLAQQQLNSQTRLPCRRTFYQRSPVFAQSAAAPAASSTSSAASTEASLTPDPPTYPPASTFTLNESDPNRVDWSKSFHGLSSEAFPKEAADILVAPIDPEIIEVKPDGIIYLPEIHYRRILNRAFGPGGWGLAPRGDTIVTDKAVTREYALVANGRLVSIARGEQDYFSKDGIPTASEGCKSNAMVRCCKDLGIASELWDPRFIRGWKSKHTREVFVEHVNTKKRTKIWLRKGDQVQYPFKETSGAAAAAK